MKFVCNFLVEVFSDGFMDMCIYVVCIFCCRRFVCFDCLDWFICNNRSSNLFFRKISKVFFYLVSNKIICFIGFVFFKCFIYIDDWYNVVFESSMCFFVNCFISFSEYFMVFRVVNDVVVNVKVFKSNWVDFVCECVVFFEVYVLCVDF